MLYKVLSLFLNARNNHNVLINDKLTNLRDANEMDYYSAIKKNNHWDLQHQTAMCNMQCANKRRQTLK